METWEERQEREHREMYVDFYIGKGPRDPPITQRVSALEVDMDEQRVQIKSINNKFWAIIVLLLSTLTAVCVDMAKHGH